MLHIYLLPMILFLIIKCIYRIPTKKNDELFKNVVLACLICLLTIKAEAFCGEKTSLSATDGRLVVLHPMVAETKDLSIILWIRDDLTEIVTIRYLNESADIQNNGYGDKVIITRDGSLTINNLTMEDQGTYIVVIKRLNQSDCKHTYDVSMSGIIPERAKTKTVHLFSYEEQKVDLPLPKHLIDQVEDVFWTKDYTKHITTTFKNGSLHVLDSGYQGRLYTSNGSLIIHDLRVEDRGKYSADINLTNNELYTQIYHLSIYRKSYYTTYGTWNVSVTEEEDLILQNYVKDMKSIDWLTPRVIRFAVTKLGGDICILDPSYSDRLSSLKDGSITIKRVTKQDKGIYRAHMFSPNGMLLEQQYHVHIYENHTLLYWMLALGVAVSLVLIGLLVYYYRMIRRGHVKTYGVSKRLCMRSLK
ncbi:cell adhesion molecule CEACAM3-like [Lithobates pipiens]